jgi:hypothetical protein
VDLWFAYDLANLIGHLSTAFPQINVRLLVAPQGEDGSLLSKEEFAQAAIADGADLMVMLGDSRRFAPELLDKMLVAAIPEFIEKEARKIAGQTLSVSPGMDNL